MPTSRIEIDLGAIDRNLGVVRSVVAPPPGQDQAGTDPAAGRRPGGGGVGICAVLKQDGYGLGAARLARRLTGAGVEMLSVYTMDEARALADAVPTTPILVLMPVHGIDRGDPLYRHAAGGRLHLVLHNADQLAALTETAARLGATIPVHVQVDTGMARGGVSPDLAGRLVESVLDSHAIRLAGLMTHFASPCCDDKTTREQARGFRDFVERVKPSIRAFFAAQPRSAPPSQADIILHAANSCAAFRSRSLHGSMVRMGQALLGYVHEDADADGAGFEFAARAQALEPAARWLSSVVHTAEIAAGSPVGYGGTWRAPQRPDGKPTRIGLIPVGYADGYPRSLGGKGAVVGFTGRAWGARTSASTEDAGATPIPYAPVVGRVSMDQITVDITDVSERCMPSGGAGGAGGRGWFGAEVELYSNRRAAPNSVARLANAAGTITHELLTRLGARVERVYTSPVQPIRASDSKQSAAAMAV